MSKETIRMGGEETKKGGCAGVNIGTPRLSYSLALETHLPQHLLFLNSRRS